MATEKTLNVKTDEIDQPTKAAPRKRAKPKSYLNTNDLEIPEEVKKAFDKLGYGLRFVRFIKAGTTNDIDYQNLGKRVQQGYTFVASKEAPELAMTSFKRDIDIVGFEGGDFKDVIVKGDLALMKVPHVNIDERTREVATIAKNQMQSVNVQARRNHLLDESKSESKTYGRSRQAEARNVSFADDE